MTTLPLNGPTGTVFQLITEHQRPIAALIPPGLTQTQIRDIYMLLPPNSFNSPQLSDRWGYALVAAPYEWADRQLLRVPCVPPKLTLKLAFL